MGVQHKSDNCSRRIYSARLWGWRRRRRRRRSAMEIMYHEFIIASTMLISEREVASPFGYDAGDRWVLSEIASVRDLVRRYHRRRAITRLAPRSRNWTERIRVFHI